MKLGDVVGGCGVASGERRCGGKIPAVGFEGRSNVEGFGKMNSADVGIFRAF